MFGGPGFDDLPVSDSEPGADDRTTAEGDEIRPVNLAFDRFRTHRRLETTAGNAVRTNPRRMSSALMMPSLTIGTMAFVSNRRSVPASDSIRIFFRPRTDRANAAPACWIFFKSTASALW